jgi:hypothetical protein
MRPRLDPLLVALALLPACAPALTGAGEGAAQDPLAVQAGDRFCLDWLRQRGVPYVEAGQIKGVRTPVEIVGPIDGIALRPRAGRAPVMDCELARALVEAVPVLHELDVRTLSFSGAYDYRRIRGKSHLSAHAHGLAIDVHGFETARGPIEVSRDYPPDPGRWRSRDRRLVLDDCVGHPSRSMGLLVRTLACRLASHPAFRHVITPDDNADHWNHLHLEAYPGSPDELYPAEARAPRAPGARPAWATAR